MKPRVVFLGCDQDGKFRMERACAGAPNGEVGILRFEGSLYFANISYFEDKVQTMLAEKPSMQFLIVDCVSINQIDASGEETLREVARRLRKADVEVLFTRVKTPIFNTLKHTGLVIEHGTEYFFRRPQEAVAYIAEKTGKKDVFDPSGEAEED